MRADFGVAARVDFPQHVGRSRIDGDRMRDHVRRPHTMTCEELMQALEGVDVLERLVPPGVRVPLVVAFGVDGHEQGGAAKAHRS